jgi:hypothetical protein
MRAQEIAPRDYSHNLPRILAAYYRQPAYAFEDHVVSRIAQSIVLEDDGGQTRDHLPEQLLTGAGAVDQITTGHDADQQSVRIHHGEALVGCRTATMASAFGQPLPHLAD